MADQTIHDELFDAATAHDDSFAPRSAKETDDAYMKRLHRAINDIPEKVDDKAHDDEIAWDELSADAQGWHVAAADVMVEGGDIPYLDGMPEAKPAAARNVVAATKPAPRKAAGRKAAAVVEPEEEEVAAEQEEEVAAEPEEAVPAPRKVAGRKAAAVPAPRKVAGRKAAAVPAPRKVAGRKAAAEPEPARKSGRKAAAEAPRKAAAKTAPARSNGGSPVAVLRTYLVQNPDATFAEMTTHMEKKHQEMGESTMRTARYWVLSTIETVRNEGHWKN